MKPLASLLERPALGQSPAASDVEKTVRSTHTTYKIMTPCTFVSLFEKHDDEYLKFDRVTNKTSLRPDLHAFQLLDMLLPRSGQDMIVAASHDEIYLVADYGELAPGISEAQVVDLIRCGVRYDSNNDCLSMFV
jgi:hypothetical protein